MRFLIGEFCHESNTFCATTTGVAAFRARAADAGSGDDFLERAHAAGIVTGATDGALGPGDRAAGGTHNVLRGFVDAAVAGGHRLILAVAASAVPGGPVAAEVYAEVKRLLLAAAREAAGGIDGVLLAMHGATSVEAAAGVEDPEGEIVAALRGVVGPALPIVVVLDPHSDTTELLLRDADLTLSFNEEPHRDAYERGLEAFALAAQIRRRAIRPVRARRRAPMLLPAINMATDHGPMQELHAIRAELERTPGVIDLSLHGGFYGSDQPEAGFSAVCATDGDPELANRLAARMAREAWDRREAFLVPLVPIPEAVRQALMARQPVGLVDECDDPAGGGSADSVAIVRGLLEEGVTRGGMSTVKDAEVARAMAAAGVGTELTVQLGAKTDRLHGEPIAVTGTVAKVHAGPIEVDTWTGMTYDAGIVGVLDVRGVLVVVTEERLVTEDGDVFAPLGFDVREMQAVGFKGLGVHIRQALAGKVERFIPVDGEGVTHPDVRKLGPFRRIRRPVWPLDELPPGAYPSGEPEGPLGRAGPRARPAHGQSSRRRAGDEEEPACR